MESSIFNKMINLYKVDNYDWMGFEITDNNPLSLYNINSGSDMSDYALLTKNGIEMIDTIKNIDRDLYDEWAFLFSSINYTEYGVLRCHSEVIYELRSESEHKLLLKI